jgi:protein arginine N-methyltransferase 1
MPDSADAPDALFVLAPEIALSLRGDGHVQISVGGRHHVASIRSLGILEQFARPRPIHEVVEGLRAAGMEEFIESTSLVMRLRDEGVLVDATRGSVRVASGFDKPWVHVAMLDDLTRTRAFALAIREVVRPGDVVVEIGTGTGVLAVEAARAGARRVYAIEEGGIAEAARRVFEANGVSDRIEVVRERSTRVKLPEQADVLVSEVLGNDPLAEDIVGIFGDARRRLLKRDARVVPRSVDVFALPVELPDEFLTSHTFTDRNAARWQQALGIDFRPLATFAADIVNLPNVKPQEASRWSAVADPVRLARIGLQAVDEPPSEMVTSFVATHPARVLGFVLYFEAELAPGIGISTSPSASADDNCWSCRVFRAVGRRDVAAGETIRLEFSAATGESVLRAF